MSKPAFTSGPWRVGDGDHGRWIIELADAPHTEVLGVDTGTSGWEEPSVLGKQPDLQLMASAPCLYAALQELVTLSEQHSAPDDVEAAFEQARSALAKARGEQ